MVEFEKLESEIFKFGEDEFIEIDKKKIVSEEGEEETIVIERGFFDDKGGKRYRNNISIPKEEEVVDFLLEKLPEFVS